MNSNRLAFAALIITCVAAGAGGGYLATRQTLPTASAAAVDVSPATAAEAPIAPVVKEPETPSPARATVSKPVQAPAVTRETAASRRTASRSAQSEQTPGARADQSSGDRPAPVTETVTPAPAAAPVETVGTNAPAGVDNRPVFQEPAPVPELPPASFEELVVSADSVIGLQLDGGLSSERAQVEDRVEARVVRDVRVGRQVAIPAGARAMGTVVLVERGGKLKDRARLGIRFQELMLSDGSRMPISTDTIYRYGDAPGDSSAKKIGGGAVAGAILGAIIGGAKGAAVGATAGAGGGTAMVMSGDRKAAEFPAGAEVTARILAPLTVTVDR